LKNYNIFLDLYKIYNKSKFLELKENVIYIKLTLF
jgi:hypothetical protein